MRYRTLWLSDTHLGWRNSQAKALLAFLDRVEADTIYLVGDIIDFWKLRRRWYWPELHTEVVQKILAKAKSGSQVVYLPGNHDEALRDFLGIKFGDIEIQDRVIHHCADGKRLLVLHGDQFDGVIKHAKWLAYLGDYAYSTALFLNQIVNYTRRKMGFTYWSLSAYLKNTVKKAVAHLSQYRELLIHAAREAQVDGVVCGHVHHAEIALINGVTYYNDGDWVESCTALVEHFDGSMEILHHHPLSQAPLSAGSVI